MRKALAEKGYRVETGAVDTVGAIAGRDTRAEESWFFSYRRATLRGEGDYGRQISAIALEG